MLIGFQDNILSSFIFTYARGIWPFLLSWNYSCCMENKEEEVFCVPCWYCPLIHLQEVNPQKFFTQWFFYFPPRSDYFFTFFLLSSSLIPARTFLKVFWNNYVRLGRLLHLAISFVSNQSSFPKEIWFHHCKWQNLKECTNLHMINHRREAIPTCSCGHCSKHLLEGWICAWQRQVQKCWSCHPGGTADHSLHKEGLYPASHSLVSCTSSSVSSCKAVIWGRGLRLLEFLWCAGSSLRRSAWLMACLKELFSFSSFWMDSYCLNLLSSITCRNSTQLDEQCWCWLNSASVTNGIGKRHKDVANIF